VRIAFVTPYGYPALCAVAGQPGGGFDYVGGAEIQQSRLAVALAARGHEVWMVSADFGQPADTTVLGVRVARAYRPFAGVPGVRFFAPRWTGIARALDHADPGVVYQRTAGALTGQVALWARARGRRFIFACAHDFDTLPASPFLANPRDRWLYRHGLRHADRVLAQSAFQAAELERHHGIRATLVRNLVDLPAAPRAEAEADGVLWLGTMKADKRPAWALDAARALPGTRFVLAGGPPPAPMPDDCWRAVQAAARALPNVELPGFVPPPGVPARLARAAVFAHSSPSEGFPNTLLEAWAHGVPSVSVVDPDGAAERSGAGVRVGSQAEFVAALGALVADPARRACMGARARAYVAEHHAPSAVVAALEQAILETRRR
jgi:glycosyltransferase involved in cell wall biosynthesis